MVRTDIRKSKGRRQEGKQSLFCKKAMQKTSSYPLVATLAAVERPFVQAERVKVFRFFFPKKQRFLPILPQPVLVSHP